MAAPKVSKNKFTHFKDSKARTVEERVDELLAEGVAVVGRPRRILANESLDLNGVSFRCYQDGIDVQVEMASDDENSQNHLLHTKGFERYLIVPSDCDQPDVIEYCLKYTG